MFYVNNTHMFMGIKCLDEVFASSFSIIMFFFFYAGIFEPIKIGCWTTSQITMEGAIGVVCYCEAISMPVRFTPVR